MRLENKIKRVSLLIERLQSGKDVSISSMSRILTKGQLDQFFIDWVEELSLRKIEKPKEIKEYERKTKVASLHYQKMERFSFIKGKARLAREYSHKADNAFEKAYEYLIERLHANSELRFWIDRDPDPSQRCPIGIPRIIGSRSFECLDKRKYPYPTLTKRELKLQTLELALFELRKDDLELNCEPTKIIHFSKSKNYDFSSFQVLNV